MSYSNENALQNLLQYLTDSYKGLAECAELTKDNSYKSLLTQVSQERKSYTEAIKTSLKALNVEPRDHGTVAGPLHRLFINIKSLFADQNVESLKTEILRGDEELVKAYNEALKNETDNALKILLNEQLHQVHQALNKITSKV